VLLPDFGVDSVRKMLDLISTGQVRWRKEDSAVIAEFKELLKLMGVDKSVFGKGVKQNIVEKIDKKVVRSGFDAIKALCGRSKDSKNSDDNGKSREVVRLESDDYISDGESVMEAEPVDKEKLVERQREERRERLNRRQRQREGELANTGQGDGVRSGEAAPPQGQDHHHQQQQQHPDSGVASVSEVGDVFIRARRDGREARILPYPRAATSASSARARAW
jgi:hypothetical protein